MLGVNAPAPGDRADREYIRQKTDGRKWEQLCRAQKREKVEEEEEYEGDEKGEEGE